MIVYCWIILFTKIKLELIHTLVLYWKHVSINLTSGLLNSNQKTAYSLSLLGSPMHSHRKGHLQMFEQPRGNPIKEISSIYLRCHTRFQVVFTACCWVFKEITLVGSNQSNYFESATACSKYKLKMRVAMQLKTSTVHYLKLIITIL